MEWTLPSQTMNNKWLSSLNLYVFREDSLVHSLTRVGPLHNFLKQHNDLGRKIIIYLGRSPYIVSRSLEKTHPSQTMNKAGSTP